MRNKPITFLKQQQAAPLEEVESSRVWQRVASELNLIHKTSTAPVAVASPHFALLQRPAFAFVMGLLLVFTGSYTAQAADAAGPGDLLYPVDLAMERVHLALTSEAKREPLRYQYALERVDELATYAATWSVEEAVKGVADERLEAHQQYVEEYIEAVSEQLSEQDRKRIRQSFALIASSSEQFRDHERQRQELEQETEMNGQETEVVGSESGPRQIRQQSPSYTIEAAATVDTTEKQPETNTQPEQTTGVNTDNQQGSDTPKETDSINTETNMNQNGSGDNGSGSGGSGNGGSGGTSGGKR